MDKEEKNLTWKYFLQQKVKEVLGFIIILLAIVFIPYLVGHNIGDNMSRICGGTSEIEECNNVAQWFEGIAYILFGAIVFIVIILIVHDWITSNWKKANKRAKKELNKIKRRKRNEKRVCN